MVIRIRRGREFRTVLGRVETAPENLQTYFTFDNRLTTFDFVQNILF